MGGIILILGLVVFLAFMYSIVDNTDKDANERAQLPQYESSKQERSRNKNDDEELFFTDLTDEDDSLKM